MGIKLLDETVASKKISNDLSVPFGRRGDRLIAPTDVRETGLACNCVCPGCGARLVTRQGSKRRHFAHYNAPGSKLCVQQSIHAAAIQVLMTAKRLTVPSMTMHVEAYSKSHEWVGLSQQLCPHRTVHFDSCAHEVTFSNPEFGTIRPDVVGYYGENRLLIEICFTHAVDAEKLAKVKRYGDAMIEIDVADMNFDGGMESLEKRVLDEVNNKKWLFYPGSAAVKLSLSAQVSEEVRLLDAQYEQAQAQSRRRAALVAAEAERVRCQAKKVEFQKLAATQAKIKAYRQKPVHEKEEDIRRWLSIHGNWPHYLRKDHPDNGAINAPVRLWQAAVFHRFIFNKPVTQTTVDSLEVKKWVDVWCGRAPLSRLSFSRAVLSFLNYLKGCGFFRYGGASDGQPIYVLVHSELVPPKRKIEQKNQHDREAAPKHSSKDEYRPTYGRLHNKLVLKDTWPEYDDVRTVLTKWLSMSQADELTMLYVLYQCRAQLPNPYEFVRMMQDEVPLVPVLPFLRSHGFIE